MLAAAASLPNQEDYFVTAMYLYFAVAARELARAGAQIGDFHSMGVRNSSCFSAYYWNYKSDYYYFYILLDCDNFDYCSVVFQV